MNRLAWIEILDRHGDVIARHAVQAWPVRLGRAYDSDVVLDDSHVAAHHLEINCVDDGCFHLRVVDSINGMTIDSQRGKQTEATISASDVIRIGQTQLRIRPLDYAVAPEKLLPSNSWMRRWPMLIIGVTVLLSMHLLALWLDYNRDESYTILVKPLLGDIPVLLLWVGFWALIGRVLSGRANFIAHTVIATLGTALILLLNNFVYGYLDFALNTNLVSDVVSEIIELPIVGTMLYLHIGLVSRIGHRRLAVIVVMLMAGLTSLIHVTDYLNDKNNLAAMNYSRTIGPPAMLLRHGESTEKFIVRAGELKGEVDGMVKGQE